MVSDVQMVRRRSRATRQSGWIAAAILIAVALAFVTWDVMDYSAGGPWKSAPLGQRWFELHKDSLLLLQPAVERYLFPGLWSAIQWLLERPAWLAPAAGGALIALFKVLRRR